MNNHITTYQYGKFTATFDNHIFQCNNKNERVAKKLYFKVYAFITINNENKLLCYGSYLHKMGFDRVNCYCFTVIIAAVYIKKICIVETLYY